MSGERIMERRQHFNESGDVSGEMSVKFDIATGKVRAYGSGFWSPKQAVAYFDDWRRIIRAIHDAGLSVSALVDMCDSAVQSPEVTGIIAKVTPNIYSPGDAIAMLVPNSLTKMQMRRVLDPSFHDFFVSRNAAETWLDGRSLLATGQLAAATHISGGVRAC